MTSQERCKQNEHTTTSEDLEFFSLIGLATVRQEDQNNMSQKTSMVSYFLVAQEDLFQSLLISSVTASHLNVIFLVKLSFY